MRFSDRSALLFYAMFPVLVLGFFYHPLWYGLAPIGGMSVIAAVDETLRKRWTILSLCSRSAKRC